MESELLTAFSRRAMCNTRGELHETATSHNTPLKRTGAIAATSMILAPSLYGQQPRDTVRIQVTPAAITTAPVRLAVVRTIGALDGPPEYAFGELSEIAVDKRGRMYTYDRNDNLLRGYDANGRFVSPIGRNG